MTTAKVSRTSVWRSGLKDLAPTPGRLAISWRVALLCALMVLMAMTYQIPESAVSCFVIFFVMKSDSGESIVMALALVVLASLVVILLVPVIQFTIEHPALRFLMIVLTSFVLLFLGIASKLGPLGGIIALVIAFVLTMLSNVPIGELATRGLLYAWLMAAAPMGLVIVSGMLFGMSPRKVLLNELALRMRLAARGLANGSNTADTLWENLSQGVEEQQKRLGWIRLFHLLPYEQQILLQWAVLDTYRVVSAVAAMQEQNLTASERENLIALCEEIAINYEQGHIALNVSLGKIKAEGVSTETQVAELILALTTLVMREPKEAVKTESTPFFLPDAWTNPAYQHHALKTTAAAIVCYLIYSALDWPGIHTAMITCYVAALASTGEAIHKLVLRILGCLLGAALGFFTVIFLVPYMTDIGSLMVVVFLVSLLGAWVFYGPERISYAGIQVAFAFFLVVLQGFSPSVDLDSARDRVIGILLGNTVMYLVFTFVWPVSVVGSIRQRLNVATQGLNRLVKGNLNEPEAVQLSARLAQVIAQAQDEIELLEFEPTRLKPGQQKKEKFASTAQQLRGQLIKIYT